MMKTLAFLLLAAGACGPNVSSDDETAPDSSDDPSGADDACGEGSCPDDLYCGEHGHVCLGGFGINPCVAGECGPAPGECYPATRGYATCSEACAATGATCSAAACEGTTAFGYPGPPEAADMVIAICGQNTEEVKSAVTRHTFGCDDELPWSEDVALFQCCCDHPDE